MRPSISTSRIGRKRDYPLERCPSAQVRVVHDRHLHGLFPRQVWLDTLAAVGFEPHSQLYEHSEVEGGLELFIGHKR